MTWLLRALRDGITWAVKNPLILVLVAILLIYNHVFGESSIIKDAHVDWTRAASIWEFLWSTELLILTPLGILIGLGSLVGSTIVTVFEIEANFAIFAQKDRPLLRGLGALFTPAPLYYFAYQSMMGAAFLLTFTGLVYLVVQVIGLTGLAGSLVLFALVTIGYPTFYLLLSTGAVIGGMHAPFSEKRLAVRTALRKENFARLFAFYVVRIGCETAAISLAILIASYFHVPFTYQFLLVTLIAVAPFAIIRTGGYMLKFDIFRDIPWFRTYFRNIYEA